MDQVGRHDSFSSSATFPLLAVQVRPASKMRCKWKCRCETCSTRHPGRPRGSFRALIAQGDEAFVGGDSGDIE